MSDKRFCCIHCWDEFINREESKLKEGEGFCYQCEKPYSIIKGCSQRHLCLDCRIKPGNVIPINLSKPCPDCGHKFKNVNDYFEHDCTEVNAPWYCSKCREMFHTRKDYKKHYCKERDMKIDPTLADAWFCPDCKSHIPNSESICYHQCKCSGQPTHTVELTEEDRHTIIDSILHKYYAPGDERYASILAKLRPKKESVEDTWTCEDCGQIFGNNYLRKLHKELCKGSPTYSVQLPKKENVKHKKVVDFDIGDGSLCEDFYRTYIHSDWMLITSPDKYNRLRILRSDFERIYAAYHDHVDEVK